MLYGKMSVVQIVYRVLKTANIKHSWTGQKKIAFLIKKNIQKCFRLKFKLCEIEKKFVNNLFIIRK